MKIDTYVVESLTTSLQKQTLAIECLLEGRDVLAVLPTVFGKSFLLAEDIRRVSWPEIRDIEPIFCQR